MGECSFTDEASVYFVSPGKQKWVSPGEAYERTKTKYSKKLHVWVPLVLRE